jgi:excisionase family DNA binding protein
MTMLEPLMTTKQVAAYLGVHPETVKLWVASGRLPSVGKIGRSWKFDQGVVRTWAKNGGHK